jgi:hypothetical protein
VESLLSAVRSLEVLKSCEAPLGADREAYVRLVLGRRRLSDSKAKQGTQTSDLSGFIASSKDIYYSGIG